MISTKCHELAFALYHMTSDVSFEQIKDAISHISQCASNTLTVPDKCPRCASVYDRFQAINGVLHERSLVLEKDFIETNYEVFEEYMNPESIWHNICEKKKLLFVLFSKSNILDLFADGDAFSDEAIKKNRNLYYQERSVISKMIF